MTPWEALQRGFSEMGKPKKAAPVDDAPPPQPVKVSSPPPPPPPAGRSVMGNRRDAQYDDAVTRAVNGQDPNAALKGTTVDKKRGGSIGKKPGGGLGALAALQGVMGGGGAGGPPPGPPMPPPGAGGGMPPPGMKRGGHVSKNAGGKPHEDMPLREAKRKAKEFPMDGGTTKEEKGSVKGAMKYAKGGKIGMHGPHGDDETYRRGGTYGGAHGHGSGVEGKGMEHPSIKSLNKAHGEEAKAQKFFAKGGVTGEPKGRALDKADGGAEKLEKGSEKGVMKYAKGGHVTGFRGGAHGIESRGKTKGKYI